MSQIQERFARIARHKTETARTASETALQGECHCKGDAKPRPDLGVYAIMVAAFLTYAAIGYAAGWLPPVWWSL